MNASLLPLSAGGLDALDSCYLTSERAPPECMSLSELDGFLAGLAVSPKPVDVAIWEPLIWRGSSPVFADDRERDAVLGAIARRRATIADDIKAGKFTPAFAIDSDDQPIAEPWAEGFSLAVALTHDAWMPLLESEDDALPLLTILGLCTDDEGLSTMELGEEERAALSAAAPDLIPDCVLAIAAFWGLERRDDSAPVPLLTPVRTGPKIGRNDPCPCGSGKKYKKCCGR